MRTEMDNLVLGSYLLEKSFQPPLEGDVDWRTVYDLDQEASRSTPQDESPLEGALSPWVSHSAMFAHFMLSKVNTQIPTRSQSAG